jgi:anti-anti-sigma factor
MTPGAGATGLEIVEVRSEGVVIVEPRGRIDSTTAGMLDGSLAGLVRSGSRRLVIDFSEVLYLTSAGFRSLLIAGKLVDQVQGRLVLCCMSAGIARLFEVGGFNELFDVCATRNDGIRKAS